MAYSYGIVSHVSRIPTNGWLAGKWGIAYHSTSKIDQRNHAINNKSNHAAQKFKPDPSYPGKRSYKRETADKSAKTETGGKIAPVVAADQCYAQTEDNNAEEGLCAAKHKAED